MKRDILASIHWIILFLFLTIAAVVFCSVFVNDPNEIADAVTATSAIVAIGVAISTSLFTWRNSLHQALAELLRSFLSPETSYSLKIIGDFFNEERMKLRYGNWTLSDCTGIRYLQSIRSDDKLDESRRQVSGIYETVCSLHHSGPITRKMALSWFSNLEERVTLFTIVEEFIALKLSISTYRQSDFQKFVSVWNASRQRSGTISGDVEVGKPNMRRFVDVTLILGTEPTRIDYGEKVFRVNVDELFGTGSSDSNAPLSIDHLLN